MRRPEQTLQIAVAEFLGHALRPPTIWTAFPAGGGGKVRGAFLKAMGLKAGWPDLIVITPAIAYPANKTIPMVIGIELKAEKGAQTATQKAVQKAWEGAAGHYRVARTVNEVEFFLRGLGVPMFARISRRTA